MISSERLAKEKKVREIRELLQQKQSLLVLGYQNTETPVIKVLRSIIADSDTKIMVAPNRLFNIAVKDTKFFDYTPELKGQNLFVIGKDSLNLLNRLFKFRKANNTTLLGVKHCIEEHHSFSKEEVILLEKIESIDALRKKVFNLIQAPLKKRAADAEAAISEESASQPKEDIDTLS